MLTATPSCVLKWSWDSLTHSYQHIAVQFVCLFAQTFGVSRCRVCSQPENGCFPPIAVRPIPPPGQAMNSFMMSFWWLLSNGSFSSPSALTPHLTCSHHAARYFHFRWDLKRPFEDVERRTPLLVQSHFRRKRKPLEEMRSVSTCFSWGSDQTLTALLILPHSR